MADLVNYGNTERDIEQALTALKKGTQLIKYSRKGKPKFCPFRVSPDETTLIWYSHGEERTLKLALVLKIIPGQRTAVFRRYSRPEKEYLSFSLLYNNGDRSLDLICKDKIEAEVWFSGLKTLITNAQNRNRRTRSDIPDFPDGSESVHSGRAFGATLDFTSSLTRGRLSVDLNPREYYVSLASSDVGSERANMQLRSSTGDGFRISVSSTPSCSSGGSGQDDIESLGDVFVWGEIWSDGPEQGSVILAPRKVDVLTPRPLESNVVLDVQQIACGARHVSLVTRQGEVFTWGEESGGRLGHGNERDYSRPHIVEFLAVISVDSVSCGEFHTCVVSNSGDLFTWGDGTHNAGLLGHGTNVSHWLPKRVSSLEGLQVLYVACGTWHTALATANGKLFTFGDGTFGALGHGDRESAPYPKEVQSLSGLKTIKVACGVWHTAAIVEVMISQSSGANISSRKLFTWGDGEKYRLGHGNKDSYLLPTCVSALIDYNFHQLACGHTMTVALTSSGHVFTMGSALYGQLGNPNSDGKVPCLVQDRLVGEFVEEISCGAFHVAVLTSRNEVYTWGKGANGRLGHGDVDDRKIPTMVEALKDRHVKNISCGSNFTASICIHKWVSGADQSVCTGCRQAFGFTRKRHNCYNCGLVHCHACSSKKALKAALAPTPGKPHRVCDACYTKLKAAETNSLSSMNEKVSTIRRSMDASRSERGDVKSSRLLHLPIFDPTKQGKFWTKSDSSRASQAPSILQVKDIAIPSSLTALQNALKPVVTANSTPPQSAPNSRPASPYSRRPSPPRSTTPVFSRSVIDNLSKTNEFLNQQITKLQNQVKSLKQKSDLQDVEIKKLNKEHEITSLKAAKQISQHLKARGVVSSVAAQLKEMMDNFPPETPENEKLNALCARAETFLNSDEEQLLSDKSTVSSEPTNMGRHNTDDPTDTEGMNDLSQNSRAGAVEDNSTASKQDLAAQQSPGAGSNPNNSAAPGNDGLTQVTEQFEPGVYVTLDVLPNGIKAFKRVRFSKRRFAEQQAEEWWNKNKERVFKKYPPLVASVHPSVSSSNPSSAGEQSDAANAPSGSSSNATTAGEPNNDEN